MTLRRKMGLQITAMIVGLALVAGASLKGFNGLRQNYGVAAAGIQQLREVYEVGSHLAAARTLLPSDRAASLNQVQSALTKVEGAQPWGGQAVATQQAMHQALLDARDELRLAAQEGQRPSELALSKAITLVRDTAYEIRENVAATEAAAEARRRTTLVSVGLLSAAVILAAVLLGLWQYRGVLNPLNRLSGAVRRVATGHFGVRIVEGGVPSGGDDNEFARLAADFNRMADQLDGFYRELEQKVAAKSKELIRSERLASVGYLAAGVAHEINNPLGIISGYAEYALAEMKANGGAGGGASGGGGGATVAADIDGTLRVIRDEAFRCKDITAKLLSLARPGDGARQRVNLALVAEQVVSILGGLRDFKDRSISVRTDSREPLVVDAVEGEMKQVLMNLLINALEATDDGDGEVRVTVSHHDHHGGGAAGVTLTVADNGRGMNAETLERVFEPFFTERRSRDPDAPARPGTGLGLSITHAIVQSHGGRITAHSDGPGRGSRFVIELPAARPA